MGLFSRSIDFCHSLTTLVKPPLLPNPQPNHGLQNSGNGGESLVFLAPRPPPEDGYGRGLSNLLRIWSLALNLSFMVLINPMLHT